MICRLGHMERRYYKEDIDLLSGKQITTRYSSDIHISYQDKFHTSAMYIWCTRCFFYQQPGRVSMLYI